MTTQLSIYAAKEEPTLFDSAGWMVASGPTFEAAMTKREMVETFKPGDRVEVTNHYINRPDHPCYGTRPDTVTVVSSSGITFEQGGRVPWPNAAKLTSPEPGRLILANRPDKVPGPFLDIRKATR